MYCPKCDMEFIEGVTVCSDCGGPLVDKEEYLKMKSAETKETVPQEVLEDIKSEDIDSMKERLEALSEVMADETHVYESKSDKYNDFKSSASAFFIVGIVMVIGSILIWTNVIKLPMVGFSAIFFKSTFSVLAVIALFIAVRTNSSAEAMHGQIREEKKATKELTNWFIDSYTPDSIDETLSSEDADYSAMPEEEKALKRLSYIQDTLATSYDISDKSYLDALSEDIYTKLYE